MIRSIIQLVHEVNGGRLRPRAAALEALAGLSDFQHGDPAADVYVAASQTFALLAVADALYAGDGLALADLLHPVPRETR